MNRGFYPKGCGEVELTTKPLVKKYLDPIELVEPGKVTKINAIIFSAGNIPPRVGSLA